MSCDCLNNESLTTELIYSRLFSFVLLEQVDVA